MSSLLSKPILLLDGGLGTTLEDEHNIKFSSETPLWSSNLLVSSPETLSKVQTDFAQAGADIVLTATYQASFEGFRKTTVHGTQIGDEDAKRYMLSSIDIAHSAFQNRKGLVGLSLGAYGATMIPSTEYSGEYGTMTEADLVKFHRERLQVFGNEETWSKIGIVAFETLPRLDEVRAVRSVIMEAPPKPYWISCVFPDHQHNNSPDGSKVLEVVEAMMKDERKPEAIGINCTKIRKVPELVLKFEEAMEEQGFSFPRLIIYPDGAGDQMYDTKTQQWVEQEEYAQGNPTSWDERMYDIVRGVQARGKWKGIIVGGCCKTTPAMISSLKARLT